MARTDTVWTNRAGEYIETTKPTGYDLLINGTDRYINFNTTNGSLGYGFRDNGGTMQFKNNAGVWTDIGAGGGGIALTDLSATTPLAYDNTTGVFSIPVADTDSDGYLSSTDWNTFNNKQAALGFTPENVANKSTNVVTDGASDTKYPSVKAIKDYADGLVAGLLDYRGGYDASVNTFPSTGGSGTAGAVLKGDMWIISVAGTLGGETVQIGDSVIANVDTPGQTSGNWNILNSNISYVPEDVANKVTSISGASTDVQYPSAKLVYDQLTLYVPYTGATSGLDLGVHELTAAAGAFGTSNDANTVLDLKTLNATRNKGLRIENDNTGNIPFSTFVSGDANLRYLFGASGEMEWGDGTNNTDTHLYRNGAGILKTDGAFIATTLEIGHATDTTISRVSAGVIAVEGIPVIIADSTTVGQIPTITGTNTYSWQTPSAGSSLWTLMPGTPTRVGNTSFTVTGDVTSYVAKGMIIKWTESGTVRVGMVSIPSTYGAPNTTITIIGDTMASIDASSLKYCMLGVEMFQKNFAVAGNIGAVATDVANAYYATEPMRVIGADLQVGTAGTTNNTTVDINIAGTTAFTTKPTLATTVAASPTPFTADDDKSLTLNQRVSIDIDAVQTTNAIDLYVQLYVLPTRYLNLS